MEKRGRKGEKMEVKVRRERKRKADMEEGRRRGGIERRIEREKEWQRN